MHSDVQKGRFSPIHLYRASPGYVNGAEFYLDIFGE